MSSVHITAARASQSAALRTKFEQCQQCGASLTIAEAIERHCIACHSKPKRIIHKHLNIDTGEAANAA